MFFYVYSTLAGSVGDPHTSCLVSSAYKQRGTCACVVQTQNLANKVTISKVKYGF